MPGLLKDPPIVLRGFRAKLDGGLGQSHAVKDADERFAVQPVILLFLVPAHLVVCLANQGVERRLTQRYGAIVAGVFSQVGVSVWGW